MDTQTHTTGGDTTVAAPSSTMPADRTWEQQLDSLRAFLSEHPDTDLACDATLARPELAWARSQQQAASDLTVDRYEALSRVPGWVWASYHDLLAAHDLPGLRYLAHSGDESHRAMARLVYLLPAESVGRMVVADDAAAARISEVLRKAARPAVRELGLHLLHLLHLLPPEARTEQTTSYIAAHLEHTGDPAVGRTLLTFLCERGEVAAAPASPPAPIGPVAGPVSGPVSGPGSVSVSPSVWPMVVTHPLATRHIAHLGLSARTHNALLRAQISRIGELLSIEDPHTLLELRGFGASCLDDLRDCLAKHGIDPPFGP